jgi:hypothetical protein
MGKNKIEELIEGLKFNYEGPEAKKEIIEIGKTYDDVKHLKDSPGKYCGVDQIANMFSWKKGMSYLFTGTPNTGKTTMVLFLYLIMSLRHGYKWCIWSPEMEDSYLDHGSIEYHSKDLIYTLMWTMAGVTPYDFYSKKHGTNLMSDEEKRTAYNWVVDHFKYIHLGDRTPAGIMEGFVEINDKYKVDGFLLDPWKSVKQNMDKRSDLWLEDALMDFKTFSLETNSIMTFVVHPKSMRDYREADGNFRVITPMDLNGGAAWNNSMDVIISLRRMADRTEWHSHKIRKQHLVGIPGMYDQITFDMNTYRFYFMGDDPTSRVALSFGNPDIDFTSGDVTF